MNQRIRGVIVPLITPFNEQGQVDTTMARPLVDFLIARGVNGLMPCGTTGEGPLLTSDERCRLAESVVEAADGRVPVIVHTGAITTGETIQLTQHARAIGAFAASMIPPFYFHYSEEALFRHFETVVCTVPDLPIYLYNNPPVTGNPLSLDLISRLTAQCPNIVGIKDSSGLLSTLAGCTRLRDGAFNTANGSDGMVLASIAMGIDATVSGNANVVPELVVSLYHAVSQGNLTLARALQFKLDAVRQLLYDGADLSLFKGIRARRGLYVGGVRRPLLQAPEAKIDQCWTELKSMGIEFT